MAQIRWRDKEAEDFQGREGVKYPEMGGME